MKYFLWIYGSGFVITFTFAISMWISNYREQPPRGNYGRKSFFGIITEEEVGLPLLVSFSSWLVILLFGLMIIKDEYDDRTDRRRRRQWNCNLNHHNSIRNDDMDIGA